MAGIRSMGAKLSYTAQSQEKFVAHLTSLGALKINNTDIDVTDHDSLNGKKEYIAGDQEYDNLSFSGNIASGDDTFQRIWTLANSAETVAFEAEYANGDKMTFSGYFASVEMGEQTTDGLMGYSGEIKISGSVTFVAKPGL